MGGGGGAVMRRSGEIEGRKRGREVLGGRKGEYRKKREKREAERVRDKA